MIPRYKAGDRVAERPKHSLLSCIRQESREAVAKFSKQRYGTVIDTFIKVSPRRGKPPMRQQVVRILWDGHPSPAEHVQMRICFIDELPQLLEEYGALFNPLDI
jgi:hypothetical protein